MAGLSGRMEGARLGGALASMAEPESLSMDTVEQERFSELILEGIPFLPAPATPARLAFLRLLRGLLYVYGGCNYLRGCREGGVFWGCWVRGCSFFGCAPRCDRCEGFSTTSLMNKSVNDLDGGFCGASLIPSMC